MPWQFCYLIVVLCDGDGSTQAYRDTPMTITVFFGQLERRSHGDISVTSAKNNILVFLISPKGLKAMQLPTLLRGSGDGYPQMMPNWRIARAVCCKVSRCHASTPVHGKSWRSSIFKQRSQGARCVHQRRGDAHYAANPWGLRINTTDSKRTNSCRWPLFTDCLLFLMHCTNEN